MNAARTAHSAALAVATFACAMFAALDGFTKHRKPGVAALVLVASASFFAAAAVMYASGEWTG